MPPSGNIFVFNFFTAYETPLEMSAQILIWRDQLNQPNKCEQSWMNIQKYLDKLKDKKKVSIAVLDFICRESKLLEIYPRVINELSKNFENDCQHLRLILYYFQTAYKNVSFYLLVKFNLFTIFVCSLATGSLFFNNSIIKDK